jgi:putative membrane protein
MKRLMTIAGAGLALGALAAGIPGAASGASSVKGVSGLDAEYLKSSMQGDLFEVRGGQMARKTSTNPAVVTLANRLVADHSKSYSESAKLARKLGVTVPKAPTPSQQWELDIVGTLTGPAFNHWYSSLETQDHVQDIEETTGEIKDGANSQVRSGARKELPMLRLHERLSRTALASSPIGG